MAERSVRTVIGYGVIGLFCAACALGFGIIMSNAGDSADGIRGISAKTISYKVEGAQSTRLTVQILKPADAAVTCTARAQRADGLVVGSEQITAAKGKTSSTQLVVLKTTDLAHTADVLDCAAS
ncbi:DUF4307 domain-containing protein [Actinocorallia sp. A-T 12471]|uniref:DUF4307 domain-containing protein n=1 Tax=Actinocorallia sp. A-T 12471 TaxID=3089813 RepID=UPI0029CCF137|nr:DUF4307 domain-containing protein [Actinocorallia sp. A-T 12471]MDX6738568.1 DUF4307 domain-containing protein [Actinocorallia sp. A-T 12471]